MLRTRTRSQVARARSKTKVEVFHTHLSPGARLQQAQGSHPLSSQSWPQPTEVLQQFPCELLFSPGEPLPRFLNQG